MPKFRSADNTDARERAEQQGSLPRWCRRVRPLWKVVSRSRKAHRPAALQCSKCASPYPPKGVGNSGPHKSVHKDV